MVIDAEYAVIGQSSQKNMGKAIKYLYKERKKPEIKISYSNIGKKFACAKLILMISILHCKHCTQFMIIVIHLHTNAYDGSHSPHRQESVRRAMAIQLIINKNWD